MKRHSVAALFTVLAVALSTLLGRTGAFKMYENKTIDLRFRWRHRLMGPQVPPGIRLIGIDDRTIAALGGRWPIPWRWHALLLEALSERLPAVVAYSVLFASAEGRAEGEEELLASATRRLGDLVYPYYFDFEEPGRAALSHYRSREEADASMLEKSAITDVEGDLSLLPRTTEVTLPIRPLAESAALGFANVQGDEEDGVVRRMPLILAFEGRVYPSFILASALRYFNIDREDVHVRIGEAVEFDIPEGPHISIPIDEAGRMHINYTALQNEFPNSVFVQTVQSFALRQRGLPAPVDLSDFEGALVLVGVTAAGAIEAYTKPTPLSPDSPLLSPQANALGTIVSRSFLSFPGFWESTALLLLLGGAVGAASGSLRAATSLILVIACLAFFIALSHLLFFSRGLILPLVPGSFTMVLNYILITSYRFATEERQRRFYRNALGKYLSLNVMEALLKDPSGLTLGGARKELTVLFADVKGFSRFCERSPVEAIAPRLNELHDRMTQIIWRHDGTLDKYMGDGIMAFWGAPLPQEDHARRAVLAAIEMTEELARMRRSWESRGVEAFSMGIGINTGTMIVGNMGASDFWDYTVLGDEVNLASRLEGLTRTHGVDMIISESTRLRVGDIVRARRLGEVTVRGKQNPVVIYELIGRK